MANVRFDNVNAEVLQHENIVLHWNSWYFFPEQLVDVFLAKVQDALALYEGNTLFKRADLERIASKSYILPNIGSNSIKIGIDINPGNYFIFMLGNANDFQHFRALFENGLVSSPILISKGLSSEQRIILVNPKPNRPFGNSAGITVQYKLYSNYSNNIQSMIQATPKVSLHIYSIDPSNTLKKEPRQQMELTSSIISVMGLGREDCPAHYSVTVKMLQFPFHQYSSQNLWILPKRPFPLGLSTQDIYSRNKLCIRQNNKYGTFPTLIEFYVLISLTLSIPIGIFLLSMLINKFTSKKSA